MCVKSRKHTHLLIWLKKTAHCISNCYLRLFGLRHIPQRKFMICRISCFKWNYRAFTNYIAKYRDTWSPVKCFISNIQYISHLLNVLNDYKNIILHHQRAIHQSATPKMYQMKLWLIPHKPLPAARLITVPFCTLFLNKEKVSSKAKEQK